jgi:hypothetical protein
LTVVVTEARKTPTSLTELKAAQLSPSELGKGWKVEHVKAATAPATFFRTCPGSPTFGGVLSVRPLQRFRAAKAGRESV